ncbi:MAG TPA: GNAT family N-acetyltransferase [Rhizomicrobium sp.]|jgi:ribosomal protein S18 acetylase RimI-like enzyme|nr:GNAT family N-acetyltransferase [Rhizomicrobium sp.]
MTMKIARLTPGDAGALRVVRLEALANHPENFGSDHASEAAQPIDWWRARMASPAGVGFGAWIGGELAGIISFGAETQEKHRHQGGIGSFYVRPGHRGQGVGDALMTAALEEAARRVEQVELTVTASNAGAIRLYERHGFETVGRKPRSIRVGDVYHDELEMWRRV